MSSRDWSRVTDAKVYLGYKNLFQRGGRVRDDLLDFQFTGGV
jgi:hypothetical protein